MEDSSDGADSLHFSIAEIEEQRLAFERFDHESQDLLLAMTLSETPMTHPDTSLDWLIAQQLDEQETVVDCPPMHNEVQTDRGLPTSSPLLRNRSDQVFSSIQEHPENFQNRSGTVTSPKAMEIQGREVAFDNGAADELPSDPAHVDTVQSDFLFAKQLQVLDTPSVAPDDDQIASDHILAKELQDIETQSQHPDHHSTEADFLLAQELQELDSQALPDHPQALPSNPDHQQLDSDLLLAQHLQEEHNTPAVELSHDERRVGDALTSLEIARDYEVALGVNQEWNKPPDTDMDELLAKQLQNEENETQTFDQTQSTHNLPPPWWTVCPNCAPNAVRKYHLIDIFPASEKWTQVTAPFTRAGYVVTKMQQIQNQTLWNRFHFERQSMRDERPAGRDLNEMLLYHTTSASKEVICEEGLDQRLSRQGRFGRGIYFSDDPIKCNQYWGQGRPRLMFACYVLLGDIKEYLQGATDPSLKREPMREQQEPGLPKTYDSVKHAWFSFTDNEDWTVLESIMDLMITDLLILAKKERAPDHFTVLENTTDGRKADFPEGMLGHNKRYICFTNRSPAPTRGRVALTELKVVSSNDNVPFGYAALTYTHDDNTKAFSSKQLLAKFTPLKEATQAVTGVVVLSPSRKEDVPAGYRRLPEINGLSICFKVTRLPMKGAHSSPPSTSAESIMDLVITDILILSKKERAPDHFTTLKNTTDGRKADFPEGRLGHTRRYLCFTKKSPAPTRGHVALTELKVISSSDKVPFGYAALMYTHDDNTKAFSSNQLLAEFTPLEQATQAVTDIVVLSPSRKEDVPAGYRRLPEINGFSICFKVTRLPKKSTHPSTTVTHAPPPPWWTVCPNCAPNAVRKYHLIDIFPASEEWSRVTAPFTRAGYVVTKMQRIQNQLLWNRLQSEKQLMKQNRPAGRDLNEMLLYHTTSASKEVICEEGLDQRLSGENFDGFGNFGKGIYFSDNPKKCDRYWKKEKPRQMFACYVLLGDIKVWFLGSRKSTHSQSKEKDPRNVSTHSVVAFLPIQEYPKGTKNSSLKREPMREKQEPGLPKTYDSVKGNVSGQNEYVVYNMYRMFPAYVLEYTRQ